MTNESNAGPWLTLAGALVVAIPTAVFTDHRQNAALEAEDLRQRTALDAEDGRQQAALAAETERLALQLEHDRRMTDIADLRRVLERALQTVHERRTLLREMHTAAPGEGGTERSDKASEMLQRTREAIDSVRIRLPKEDPLYIATARLDLAISALSRQVARDQAQYEQADQEWHAAYYNVVAEAHRRVGAHL